MNSKRQAKKVLKLYAKEAYRQRIKYVDSFLDVQESFVYRISYRHMAKRCMMAVLILVLSFALLVVGASAMGLNLFNFSFIEKENHTEIVSNENTGRSLDEQVDFFEVGYVPEGYNFIDEDNFEDISLLRVYQDENNHYLYIEQSLADGYKSGIDNEHGTVYKKNIRQMEVYIYDYGEQKIYMMQKGDMVININGVVETEEFEKIIYGLN